MKKPSEGNLLLALSNLTESSRNGLMWATVVLFTWWGVFKFSFGGTKYHVLEEGFTPKNADGKARRSYPMLIPWETVEKVSIEAEPRRFNYLAANLFSTARRRIILKKQNFQASR